ncbi:MAG: hypothetical protein U0271_35070 [Polyangiaceae bacterium]
MRYSLLAPLLPVLLLGVSVSGCGDDDPCAGDACPATGGSGGAGAGPAGGAGGEGGAPAAICDPALIADGESVDASCGLFVDPSVVFGNGSRSQPFPTIAEALTVGGNTVNIYVCSTSAPVVEATVLGASEHLYGGLSCDTWVRTDNKTEWSAPENTPVLTLDSTTGVVVDGFAIHAASATGTVDGKQGNSSIAILAQDAVATLSNLEVVAGAGADGAAGMGTSGQANGRQSDAASFDGNAGAACNVGAGGGGDAKTFTCGANDMTTGGIGGDGGMLNGGSGQSGAPDIGLGEPDGSGGVGEDNSLAWSCATTGGGQIGHAGKVGVFGAGGTSEAQWTTDGYVGSSGGDGAPGKSGQGGGGGGGRRTSALCLQSGAAGGSGGAGGCGGLAGTGGGAGGASIALVSLDSTLLLSGVTLTAQMGGAGGVGGDAQLGGDGGLGGLSAGDGCVGGDGGKGGIGGTGGGGAGGPSYGVAYRGDLPVVDEAAITVAAQTAAGGNGGLDNLQGNAGAHGTNEKTFGF